ncbi:hypothetical protein AB0M28_20440 [Streptomyces sp. NPDC051940]|uniref:hypothetical protein n=1 Tax=Streptomyces sp. NPDC051940 TaxID=3155675 RepID=UPI00344A4146
MTDWPAAEIDTVARLRALAAGVHGAAVTERVVDAPYDTVWPLLTALEGVVTDLHRVRIQRSGSDTLTVEARSRYGLRARLHGVQQPGYCWLQSRFLLVGFAAVPQGARTRVAFTGGVRVPGRAALVPLGVRREGRASLERLARRAAG